MGKDLQEESNIKLQLSFKKILELIDNGNFYIDLINEHAAGNELSNHKKEDLYSRNKISLNLTIELTKLPGMENHESTLGNLVNSTVIETNDYYKEAVSNAMQDLKDTSAIYDVLNNFIASKVNTLMDDIIEKRKLQTNASDINNIKTDLVKELSASAVKDDMNKHLQLLIEKNLADPNFISKLQASVNYEQFKKSIIKEDNLDFSQCISTYVSNKLDQIVQQKQDELIEEIKKEHPETIKSEKFTDYVKSKFVKNNEKIKSTILLNINQPNEQDMSKLKDEMGKNINNDDKLNDILNNFMFDKVNKAVEQIKNNTEEQDEYKSDDDNELTTAIKDEIDGYIAKLIANNTHNSNIKDISMVLAERSALINGS